MAKTRGEPERLIARGGTELWIKGADDFYDVQHGQEITLVRARDYDALRAERDALLAERDRMHAAGDALYESMDCQACRISSDFTFCAQCVADREQWRNLAPITARLTREGIV